MRYHSWNNFTYFSKNNEEHHTFTTSTFRALVNTIVLVKVASISVKMSHLLQTKDNSFSDNFSLLQLKSEIEEKSIISHNMI